MTVKCGHCSTHQRPVYHQDAQEVKICAFYTARSKVHQQNIANVRQEVASKPRPNDWQSTVPRAMVENMREGRYAASPTGEEDYDHHVFLRVWRPKSGKKKDCLILRTQHSDSYRDFITIYPSGSVWFAKNSTALDMALLKICANPFGTAMRYAELKNVCCRCGKQLTDERSRWYGIGPECKEYFPEIINEVNDTKGSFGGW